MHGCLNRLEESSNSSVGSSVTSQLIGQTSNPTILPVKIPCRAHSSLNILCEINYSASSIIQILNYLNCKICNPQSQFICINLFTVYVKNFVVDLISLFSWLASIHENFSLSEVSPTKFFPTNFLFRLGTCHQTDSAVPDLHSNIPTSLLR